MRSIISSCMCIFTLLLISIRSVVVLELVPDVGVDDLQVFYWMLVTVQDAIPLLRLEPCCLRAKKVDKTISVGFDRAHDFIVRTITLTIGGRCNVRTKRLCCIGLKALLEALDENRRLAVDEILQPYRTHVESRLH